MLRSLESDVTELKDEETPDRDTRSIWLRAQFCDVFAVLVAK